MDIDRILSAGAVLTELSDRFGDMPEEREKAVQAALHLVIANTYLTEIAHHLAEGRDMYDAVLAAVRGDMKIPESKQTLFTILANLPKQPPKD